MAIEPGEVQILRGPGLSVTDRRIVAADREIAVVETRAPQLETAIVQTSATAVVATVGLVIFALGLWVGGLLVWLLGLTVMAFSALAKIKRRGFSLSVESQGERMSIYKTHNEADAKLALAALIEAQKRAAA